MNIALWICQGLLALLFPLTGFMKVSRSKDQLKKMRGKEMDWVDDVSDSTVKMIGTLELLAGIGLVLPQLTGILPWLTPLAATGLIFTMIGALTLNVRNGNRVAIVENIVLLLVSAFVAYGRFVLLPA